MSRWPHHSGLDYVSYNSCNSEENIYRVTDKVQYTGTTRYISTNSDNMLLNVSSFYHLLPCYIKHIKHISHCLFGVIFVEIIDVKLTK